MATPYYLLLSLGGAFIVIGVAILILVLKFFHTNRVKHIITALVFLIGGVGIVVILIAFIPSPPVQHEYISQMLNPKPEEVNLLTIYDRNNVDDSVIKRDEQQLLRKWASILQSCQSFNPNHPRYEERYMVIVSDDAGNIFLYEVAIDKKLTDTADLRLIKKSEPGGSFSYIGTYRCNGLYKFIGETGVIGK